jgi:sigma-B regulation protein RsbU (phosphoserine phosphatase)
MVLLYTDGAIDARHSNGESFGLERLSKEAAALGDGSAQEQCDKLWQLLEKFQSKTPQEDDVTLVTVRSTV